MLRRFVIAIVLFLIVAIIAADRVGALVGGHVLAGKVQTDEHLQHRPSVTIKGTPFLTQALSGKYSNVQITDHDVLVNQVPVATLFVAMHGVHVPLGKTLHGSVSRVPVDHITGSAFVSWADANSYLAHHVPSGTSLHLSPGTDGHTVNVVGRVSFAGQQFPLSGSGRVTVAGNVVKVDVSGLTPGATKVAPGLVTRGIARAPVSFPLQNFPFQLRLTSVTVTPLGLSGTGHADHVVLGSHHHR